MKRQHDRIGGDVDLEALVAPISEDQPAGPDLREDSAVDSYFFQLKDARAEARDVERKFGTGDVRDEQAEAAGPWRKVLDLAPRALAEKSKDLEIAAWYVEALARFEGFSGLRDGFRLIAELVERYWDAGLYPAEDEDGVETRVAPLAALNGVEGPGTLIRPIKMIPFSQEGDSAAFAFWQYEQAVALSRITDPDRLQAKIDEGATTLDVIRRATNQSQPNFLKTTYTELQEAIDSYRALSTVMSSKVGSAAPPTSNIIAILEEVQRAMRSLAPQVAESTTSDAAEPGAPDSGPVDGGGAPAPRPGAATGAIVGREDALKRLLDVADYFARAEPTSVISLSLRELVRRARMSLPELLDELLADEPSARDNFLMRAGIRPTRPQE